MATTRGTLTAGKAPSGRQRRNGKGGNGRVAGLVATAALGLTLLGGVGLSQAHRAAPAAPPPAAVQPIAGDSGHVSDQFTYREDLRGGLAAPFVPDRLTYREDHREDLRPVAAISPVADQFTYREDHRVGAAALAGTEGFRYREDHRAATATWSPDFWTYREDHR